MIADFFFGILEFLVDLWSLTWFGDSDRQKDEKPPRDDRPHYPDLEPRQ